MRGRDGGAESGSRLATGESSGGVSSGGPAPHVALCPFGPLAWSAFGCARGLLGEKRSSCAGARSLCAGAQSLCTGARSPCAGARSLFIEFLSPCAGARWLCAGARLLLLDARSLCAGARWPCAGAQRPCAAVRQGPPAFLGAERAVRPPNVPDNRPPWITPPPLSLWPFGPLALWPFGPLALWPFGPLALWQFGHVPTLPRPVVHWGRVRYVGGCGGRADDCLSEVRGRDQADGEPRGPVLPS